MKVPAFKILEHTPNQPDKITEICVIDKQAFYKSSGEQSSLEDVWLPFNGFGKVIPGYTGMVHKPSIAHNVSSTRIRSLFPSRIAEQLSNPLVIEKDKWGRFKNMKCLYISYLLSGSDMPERLRSEIRRYVVETHADLTPYFTNEDPIELNANNIILLNQKLQDFGADLYQDNLQSFSQAAMISDDIDEPVDESASEAGEFLDYPDVLQGETELMDFIDQVPSMYTRMMRTICCCCRRAAPQEEKKEDTQQTSSSPIHNKKY